MVVYFGTWFLKLYEKELIHYGRYSFLLSFSLQFFEFLRKNIRSVKSFRHFSVFNLSPPFFVNFWEVSHSEILVFFIFSRHNCNFVRKIVISVGYFYFFQFSLRNFKIVWKKFSFSRSVFLFFSTIFFEYVKKTFHSVGSKLVFVRQISKRC